MTRFRLTFDATVIGLLEPRRVSAIRSGKTKDDAIAQLASDYSNITNLIVEVL